MTVPNSKDFREFCRIVFICIGWYIISSTNGVVGKWILNDFPYPMTLTMVQLLSVAVYSGPMLSFLGVRMSRNDFTWKYFLKLIVPLAFGKFASSVLAHISIWKVPVSYAHTVKASMPLFTVILSRIMTGDRHSLKVYASLVPIIGGVAVATVTEVSFDVIGLMSALMATAGFSLMNIFSKKVLKETGVHHLSLLCTLGRLAWVMFLPLWLFYDLGHILSSSLWYSEQGDQLTVNVLFLLIVDGVLHWLQNILAFTLLKLVAPLTYAVANVTKRVAIISVSLLLLQNQVTGTNVCGMAMAVSGVFFYNKVKFDENKAKLSLPTSMSTKTAATNGNPFVHSRFEPNKVNIASTPYTSNGTAPYNSFHRTN